MSKRFKDLSFQSKLFLTNLAIVLLVVIIITVVMTHNASQMISRSYYASLHLLTEQASVTFGENLNNLQNALFSSSLTSRVGDCMRRLQELQGQGSAYRQASSDLQFALSTMMGSSSMYDSVSVRLPDGECFGSQSSFAQITAAAETGKELLCLPQYSEKSYGHAELIRTDKGEMYLLRDVYTTSPLKYVGRMAAHIRSNELFDLQQYDHPFAFSVMFYSEEDDFLASAGMTAGEEASLISQPVSADGQHLSTPEETYVTSVLVRGGWKTVGLMPLSAVHSVQDSNLFTCIAVALLGILIGLISAQVIGHGLTRRVHKLVQSMNRFSAGERNVRLPVDSQDDIGVLTSHFNQMTQSVSELMERLVEEEHHKQEAEYQNLEYRYRFLQWQINPHFIYNALETVNALAKLDANPELSDMITMLSDYFRQNAEAMRMRFMTVRAEFKSLEQYVEIYRHIYGEGLTASFSIAQGAEMALVPTMIIQPILENALIHGNAYGAHCPVIRTTAEIISGQLVICIRDQGQGMSQDTIDKLLGTQSPRVADGEQRTSLGIRNVLDRMHLLYGESASMAIESCIDEGTCVRVTLPLLYSEADFVIR